MPSSPHEIASYLWATWLVSWLLAGVWSGRTVARPSFGGQLLHGIFISGGTILLFARPAALAGVERPLYPELRWLNWVEVAVAFAGLVYSWWARVHLGRLWSGSVTLKEGHTIVRTGPYRVTRHPIYSGLLLALAATAALRDAGAAFLGLGLLLIGIVLKVLQEERLLTAHFGAAYREYRAQVPALVPGIW